jgi:hypothetical protein
MGDRTAIDFFGRNRQAKYSVQKRPIRPGLAGTYRTFTIIPHKRAEKKSPTAVIPTVPADDSTNNTLTLEYHGFLALVAGLMCRSLVEL